MHSYTGFIDNYSCPTSYDTSSFHSWTRNFHRELSDHIRFLLMKFLPLMVLYNNVIITLDMKMKLVYFQVYSINNSCYDNHCKFSAQSLFIKAPIRDTYFAVILYTCGRTSSCTCYLHSFSGYRQKKCMFICRQNWNTQ